VKERINIVGAGPAGLTAAIVLARHGYAVRVFEMAPDVGHRLSGDFQGLENWSSEKDVALVLGELGIRQNFLFAPYHGGTIYTPLTQSSKITSERPIFYLVRRGSGPGTLDAGLKEQALASGVEILFNRRADVHALKGKTIVATGPRGYNAVASGITFETDMQDHAALVFHDKMAPKGYAYLLVNKGLGTMATVLYREHRQVNDCFLKTAAFFREHLDVIIRNEKIFGSYGNFFMSDTQVLSDKLYVGEAAGFQDCLWGFGLRYAIVSGHLAARSIVDGCDYDTLWKEGLKGMLETSLINRYLFERWGHRGYRYLARKFSSGNPCAFLRKHYNHSSFKHLLLPLAHRAYEERQCRQTAFVNRGILTDPALRTHYREEGSCEDH
jgi:flavin-dependent dehydrogenase